MAEPVRQMTLRTPEPARCSHCDAPLAPGEYHPDGCPQPTDWKAEAALWKKEFDDARDHYEDILSEQDAEIEQLRARVAELEEDEHMSSKTTGQMLHALRRKAGLTRKDLAELTGLTPNRLAHLELSRNLSIAAYEDIARATGHLVVRVWPKLLEALG